MVSQHNITTHSELRRLEQLVTDNTACVNKIRAFRSVQQLAEYQHEYREKHKDEIDEYQRQYREANRDRVRNQIHRLPSQRIECPCGLTYTRYHKARHDKSKRYQDLIAHSD
ncbi:hypothetical protein Plhal304r1_c027g0091391 [Plasmopara halstedii]